MEPTKEIRRTYDSKGVVRIMRINNAHLEAVVSRINEVTKSPLTYADNKTGEKFKSNIGHYHIDKAYGGNKLVRTSNTCGAISDITYGFVSKRELYEKMQSYLSGLEFNNYVTKG